MNDNLVEAIERICRTGGTLTLERGYRGAIAVKIRTSRGSYFAHSRDATTALGSVVAKVLLDVPPDRRKQRRTRARRAPLGFLGT